VALRRTVSNIAVITAVHRRELATLFATIAPILATTSLKCWRRSTVIIAEACLLRWACLRLAALSESLAILGPTTVGLATGLLAMISRLALTTDLIAPSHRTRVRSISIRSIPRDHQNLSLPKTAKAAPTPELDNIQDSVDDELERKTKEFDCLLSTALLNIAKSLVVEGADAKILLINGSLGQFLETADRGDFRNRAPKATAHVFIAQLWQVAKNQRTCLVSSTPLNGGGMKRVLTNVTEQRSALRMMTQACDAAEHSKKVISNSDDP
jgi:hypothetical protein